MGVPGFLCLVLATSTLCATFIRADTGRQSGCNSEDPYCRNGKCPDWMYQCDNGECGGDLCDGITDCEDGSDENKLPMITNLRGASTTLHWGEGSDVQLTCELMCNYSPRQYHNENAGPPQWYHNGSIINFNSSGQVSVNNTGEYIYKSILTLKSVNYSSSGNYTCHHPAGLQSSHVMLYITTKCPDGFVRLESSPRCFRMFNDEEISWNEAHTKCRQENLHMATHIDDIAIPLRKGLLDTFGSKSNVWLNARGYGYGRDIFIWQQKGEVNEVNNSLWQPNSPGIYSTKYAVILDVWEKGWNKYPTQPYTDSSTYSTRYTLCERSITEHTSTQPSSASDPTVSSSGNITEHNSTQPSLATDSPVSSSDATVLSDPWLSSVKCGPKNRLPDGRPAECDPNGDYPCCNPISGWCGNTPGHCDCNDCIDYKKHTSTEPSSSSDECNSADKNCNDGRCGYEDWKCNNGQCILKKYICDGDMDCGDGSDEEVQVLTTLHGTGDTLLRGEGTDVQLTCELICNDVSIYSYRPAKYRAEDVGPPQWYYNGSIINFTSSGEVSVKNVNGGKYSNDGEYNSVLTLKSVNYNSTGNYTCSPPTAHQSSFVMLLITTECPDDFFRLENSDRCFRMFNDEKISRNEAQKKCRQENLEMISNIDDIAVQLRKGLLDTFGDGSSVWINARINAKGIGQWTWQRHHQGVMNIDMSLLTPEWNVYPEQCLMMIVRKYRAWDLHPGKPYGSEDCTNVNSNFALCEMIKE